MKSLRVLRTPSSPAPALLPPAGEGEGTSLSKFMNRSKDGKFPPSVRGRARAGVEGMIREAVKSHAFDPHPNLPPEKGKGLKEFALRWLSQNFSKSHVFSRMTVS